MDLKNEITFLVFCCLLRVFVEGQVTSIVVNDRPIIGILAQEIYDKGDYDARPNNSYIAASYVKFLEGAGARVVPILINKNETYLRNLFKKINGLLIPGGSVPFALSVGTNGFVDAGRLLLNLSKEANDAGDFFPVWATCLGFEFLLFDAAKGQEVRADCGAWNVKDKLKFTRDAEDSRLFGKAPKSVVKTLATSEVTVNFHHFCVTPENFTKFGLNSEYTYLSINYDAPSNLTYISSIEHREYPFFGVQFHPEKNIYEWTSKEKIPHSPQAIESAQYFANFFVNQARRNAHSFSSEEEEIKYLIYNYQPKFTAVSENSTFYQKYFFEL